MSQTESIKRDKIKALALAKDCYAMKLELLTNATVVDDAIRFVASQAAKIEKANSDNTIVTNEEISVRNHIPGFKTYSSGKQQLIANQTTNNSIF